MAAAAPPDVAGAITAVSYRTDTAWTTLGAAPPSLPLGTKEYLKVAWGNTGAKAITGTVTVELTGPDAKVTVLSATKGQGQTLDFGKTAEVEFEAFTVAAAGTYTAKVTLKGKSADMAQPVTLHQVSVVVAKAAAVDLTTQMVSLLLITGFMAAMANMTSEMFKKG
jgi:hypothetical protein